MRKRTQAREIALQALYQHEIQRRADQNLKGAWEEFLAETTGDPGVREYARFLMEGVLSRLEELDGRIADVAENWNLNRIAIVDRCILRMALFELLESADVPPKVAINEAIDLAKKFSTEQSGNFVNGILDKVYSDMRAQG